MTVAELISVCGAALAAAAVAVWLKGIKPEFSIAVTAVTGAAITVFALLRLTPALSFARTFSALASNADFGTVIRIMAVAVVIELAADVCRDAGESSTASRVELLGKVAVIITALPLFKSAVSLITEVAK
ncbi:MAG: hypothetical protein II808_02835 [Clostridia bacterium]|nr:hypothetical protein [Clostridia bacterium]